MTTAVSRILCILCIMFKPAAFFIITPFSLLCMKIGIFLTCGKYLHDRIISLRVKIWAHKTSAFPGLFIDMHVPTQECERSCICILGVSILPLPTIFIFDFGIVPTMWYSLFFILFQLKSQSMFCSWVLSLESMKYVEYHGLTASSHINTPILARITQH